jgi:hypothetical protein
MHILHTRKIKTHKTNSKQNLSQFEEMQIKNGRRAHTQNNNEEQKKNKERWEIFRSSCMALLFRLLENSS